MLLKNGKKQGKNMNDENGQKHSKIAKLAFLPFGGIFGQKKNGQKNGVKGGKKGQKMGKAGQKLAKTSKSGPRWLQVAKTGLRNQKWPKIASHVQSCVPPQPAKCFFSQ